MPGSAARAGVPGGGVGPGRARHHPRAAAGVGAAGRAGGRPPPRPPHAPAPHRGAVPGPHVGRPVQDRPAGRPLRPPARARACRPRRRRHSARGGGNSRRAGRSPPRGVVPPANGTAARRPGGGSPLFLRPVRVRRPARVPRPLPRRPRRRPPPPPPSAAAACTGRRRTRTLPGQRCPASRDRGARPAAGAVHPAAMYPSRSGSRPDARPAPAAGHGRGSPARSVGRRGPRGTAPAHSHAERRLAPASRAASTTPCPSRTSRAARGRRGTAARPRPRRRRPPPAATAGRDRRPSQTGRTPTPPGRSPDASRQATIRPPIRAGTFASPLSTTTLPRCRHGGRQDVSRSTLMPIARSFRRRALV